MARMHGEHKNAYAARQATRVTGKTPDEILRECMAQGDVEWPRACECPALPFPHLHNATPKLGREK
jgi:hypothetical protein